MRLTGDSVGLRTTPDDAHGSRQSWSPRAADAAKNGHAQAHDATSDDAFGPLIFVVDSTMLSCTDALVDPLTDHGALDPATVARRAIRRALKPLGYLTGRTTAHSSTDLEGESGGDQWSTQAEAAADRWAEIVRRGKRAVARPVGSGVRLQRVDCPELFNICS